MNSSSPIAGYVIAVGLLLGISYLFEGVLLDPKPPGNRLLIVFAIIFVGAGTYTIYLLQRGKLKISGKSIVEVRKDAEEKMDDPAMLAQIALEDQNSKVRRTAEKRLEEINTTQY